MGMGSMGTETRVRNYTEGKIAIDVYDVESRQPAWHGWATKRLSNSEKQSEEEIIQTIVSQLLISFNQ
jgi:hypothetical protein